MGKLFQKCNKCAPEKNDNNNSYCGQYIEYTNVRYFGKASLPLSHIEKKKRISTISTIIN